jgi:transposase
MEMITTIGLDIAKHVFQVHGVDSAGNVAIKRRLRRGEVLTFFAKLQPTLIGIEACATSHYWARELSAMGHNVKLMPPHYVHGRRSAQSAGSGEVGAGEGRSCICAIEDVEAEFFRQLGEARHAADGVALLVQPR